MHARTARFVRLVALGLVLGLTWAPSPVEADGNKTHHGGLSWWHYTKRVELCWSPSFGEPRTIKVKAWLARKLLKYKPHRFARGPCEEPGCGEDAECPSDDLCHVGVCGADGQCTTEPVVCEDGDPCTLNACDPNQGCVADIDVGAGCDDGNACSQNDSCDMMGFCAGDEIPDCCLSDEDCTDDSLCTIDTCLDGICTNTEVDCRDEPQNACELASCDETTGACVVEAVTCDDGNLCTVDVCDVSEGCTNVADDSLCDDDNACTAESCDVDGNCASTPVEVDDGVRCTVDACDPLTGISNTPDDSLCEDEVTFICNPSIGCECRVECVTNEQCGPGESCRDTDCQILGTPTCDATGELCPDGCGSGTGVGSCPNCTLCSTKSSPGSLCVAGTCGDGVLDNGEECDDGNTDDGDGCSASCAITCPCWDGSTASPLPNPNFSSLPELWEKNFNYDPDATQERDECSDSRDGASLQSQASAAWTSDFVELLLLTAVDVDRVVFPSGPPVSACYVQSVWINPADELVAYSLRLELTSEQAAVCFAEHDAFTATTELVDGSTSTDTECGLPTPIVW